MRLVCDDYNETYYWTEDGDENIQLSPSFDYEEDALQWKERMAALLKEEK